MRRKGQIGRWGIEKEKGGREKEREGEPPPPIHIFGYAAAYKIMSVLICKIGKS